MKGLPIMKWRTPLREVQRKRIVKLQTDAVSMSQSARILPATALVEVVNAVVRPVPILPQMNTAV